MTTSFALFPFHATTRDIGVHVAVTYLPEQSEPDRGRWFWAYHIRIENRGDQPAQLLTRHWISRWCSQEKAMIMFRAAHSRRRPGR